MRLDLDPNDRDSLEALARATGKPVDTLVRELLHEVLAGRAVDGAPPQAGFDAAGGEESFLDAAVRLGAVGCVRGGPTDLSTNPRWLEGFGED